MNYLSRTGKLGMLAASAILLGACGTSLVPQANETDLSGTDFNHHLARNYRDSANFEAYKMYDWSDGILYADKALASAGGKPPAPDDMKSRSIDGAAEKDELIEARRQLVAALDGGAARAAPQNAASAQANFDCWVEQQEEGWQVEDIAACKEGFWTAMRATDLAMKPEPVKQAAVEPEPQPVAEAAPAAPKSATYLVLFDWDKSVITPEGMRVIDDAMSRLQGDSYSVRLIGHTDTSGTSEYNMALSEERAEAVKQVLVARGVSPSAISTSWVGESGVQRVTTVNGVREADNRWVGINLQENLTAQ